LPALAGLRKASPIRAGMVSHRRTGGGTSENRRGAKDAALGRLSVFSKACQSWQNTMSARVKKASRPAGMGKAKV